MGKPLVPVWTEILAELCKKSTGFEVDEIHLLGTIAKVVITALPLRYFRCLKIYIQRENLL